MRPARVTEAGIKGLVLGGLWGIGYVCTGYVGMYIVVVCSRTQYVAMWSSPRKLGRAWYRPMFLQLQGHHSPPGASPASFQPSVVHEMWVASRSGGLASRPFPLYGPPSPPRAAGDEVDEAGTYLRYGAIPTARGTSLHPYSMASHWTWAGSRLPTATQTPS